MAERSPLWDQYINNLAKDYADDQTFNDFKHADTFFDRLNQGMFSDDELARIGYEAPVNMTLRDVERAQNDSLIQSVTESGFDPNQYVSDLNYATLNDIVQYGANLETEEQRRAARIAAQRRMNELAPPVQPTGPGMGTLGTQQGVTPAAFDPGVSVGTMNLDPTRGMLTAPEGQLSLGQPFDQPDLALGSQKLEMPDTEEVASTADVAEDDPFWNNIFKQENLYEGQLEKWEQGGYGGDASQFRGSAEVLGLDHDTYGAFRSDLDRLNYYYKRGEIDDAAYTDYAWKIIDEYGVKPVQQGTDKLRWLDPGSGVDIYTPKGYDVNLAGNWGEEGSALMRRDARTEGEGPIGQFNEAKTLAPLIVAIAAPHLAGALGISGGLATGAFTGAATAGASALAGNPIDQALLQGLSSGIMAGTIPTTNLSSLDPNVIYNLAPEARQALFEAARAEGNRQLLGSFAVLGINNAAEAAAPDIEWQPADVSDVLGDVQVQVPDYQMPDEEAGGGGGATSESSAEPEQPSEPSGGDDDTAILDNERPWRYEGNGVLVNVLTGDTVEIGDEEASNLVVGDFYSRGGDAVSGEPVEEEGQLVTGYQGTLADLFGDVFATDPFGDTTADGTVDGDIGSGDVGEGDIGDADVGDADVGDEGEGVSGDGVDGDGDNGTGEGPGGDGEGDEDGDGDTTTTPTAGMSAAFGEFDPFRAGISYDVPMLTRVNTELRNFLAELYNRG